VLRSIQIRNFAIIDEVDIEFDCGLTVLTGETGAGKSILVDAMGLVLGERGGTGLVRSGATRAEFTAEFDLSDLKPARDWLVENMLDLDDDCILRRVIGADGRSRAFINGNNVPLQSLKGLGEMLLDIHGQHFHQSLGRREVQRHLLDYYGGLVDLAVATANAYREWRELADRLDELRAAKNDRNTGIELLKFQVNEIEALDLEAGEYDELQDERLKLQNGTRLAVGVSNALQQLFDGEQANANSIVADALRQVDDLARVDAALEPIAQMLREAGIQVAEAADTLRRYGDSLDMDPARLDLVEERLDAITTIARKHRVQPEDLPGLLQRLAEQLDALEHAEERGEQLETAVREAEQTYAHTASRLSAGRLKAGKRFSAEVTKAMSGLGMPGGKFEIAVSRDESAAPRACGADDIEFLISANPGQEPLPLARVASGGELSRMSLAIQVVASDGSEIPTMVFDEVDSGVGGGVAEMVGRRLRELGQSRQVFCVTHLPQVASLGDNHFRVMKVSDGKSTKTGIHRLADDERVEEIARMLGGVEITQRTRDHAAEMLDRNRDVPIESTGA
jgi:DNA repair protein RecN (Recombination protein N)